jgi:hypothetical protein
VCARRWHEAARVLTLWNAAQKLESRYQHMGRSNSNSMRPPMTSIICFWMVRESETLTVGDRPLVKVKSERMAYFGMATAAVTLVRPGELLAFR